MAVPQQSQEQEKSKEYITERLQYNCENSFFWGGGMSHSING